MFFFEINYELRNLCTLRTWRYEERVSTGCVFLRRRKRFVFFFFLSFDKTEKTRVSLFPTGRFLRDSPRDACHSRFVEIPRSVVPYYTYAIDRTTKKRRVSFHILAECAGDHAHVLLLLSYAFRSVDRRRQTAIRYVTLSIRYRVTVKTHRNINRRASPYDTCIAILLIYDMLDVCDQQRSSRCRIFFFLFPFRRVIFVNNPRAIYNIRYIAPTRKMTNTVLVMYISSVSTMLPIGLGTRVQICFWVFTR